MAACLTEPKRLTESMPGNRSSTAGMVLWIRWVLTATIAVGLLWRVVRYFAQFPIWGDEAMLLLNILDRDFTGLTYHLNYSQVAPLLFLWLEKIALLCLGSSECSVHFFPMMAGLLAFLIFWRMCRTHFAPMSAGLAIGILAVSYYPVRHASEVKPYAFDLFYAVVFSGLTLEQLHKPQEKRWLTVLVLITPLAVFSSYPSVFVGGAVSVVLLPLMRSATGPIRGLYLLYNFVLLGSFLIHYGMVGHHQIDAAEAQKTREFLRTYWKDAFPPDAWHQWPLWLVQVHTGNMLAYPLGAKHGGSTLTFLLVLLGTLSLWRQGKRSLLALCWLPFGLNLVAAILGKYPFGESARITLHLAPFICILMAHGAAHALARVPSQVWHDRLYLTFCLILMVCGTIGLLRDLMNPYKTEHDRATRQVVRMLARQVAPGEPVLLGHQEESELLAEFTWYLRTELPAHYWRGDWTTVVNPAKSLWLVQCSHEALKLSEVTDRLDAKHENWRTVRSEISCVPPENAKMLPFYCHQVQLERR